MLLIVYHLEKNLWYLNINSSWISYNWNVYSQNINLIHNRFEYLIEIHMEKSSKEKNVFILNLFESLISKIYVFIE